MVILAETKDMPRLVRVKRNTFEAHVCKPPKGADIFSWTKHEKKHRKVAKKKKPAAKTKKPVAKMKKSILSG